MSRCVRPVHREDIPDLVRLCHEHAQYERAAWNEHDRAAKLEAMLLNREDARCWVADGTGELAGFASAFAERSTWDAGPYLHLDCLYLRPNYRQRGLGRELMVEVARWSVHEGLSSMQWQTPRWNRVGAGFYERLGAVGVEKIRYTLPLDQCVELTGHDPARCSERGLH